ncbi:RNA polymerase II holoenzyme cyclin-like subunit [Ascosphaera pollenicola]|nr:RNA polymerase II holoenzyme cyclin-like subunit [Ascosphaera pollenicola]
MAGNYWASTQRRFWLLERDDLDEIRRELKDEQPASVAMLYPVPEMRLFNIFIHSELQKLTRRLMARQRALATAQVYIRRFYTKVHPRDTNPYLILVTALYIACKVEECPQHIRLVASESRNIWPDFILAFPPTASTGSGTADIVSRIGECEFWIISELSARLIVHHPFGTMQELKALLELTDAEMKVANGIVNDTYASDMCLLFPPYVIAVMAVVMAVMFGPPARSARDGGGVVAQIQAQRQEQKQKEQQQQQQKQGMATWQAMTGTQGRPAMLQQHQQHHPRYPWRQTRLLGRESAA